MKGIVMSTLLPHFRGRSIPKGDAFGWELFITIGDWDEQSICMTSQKAFPNAAEALADMRGGVERIVKDVCHALGLPAPAGVEEFAPQKPGEARVH